MNRLPLHKRTQLLHLLCEGSSLRAAGRVAQVAFNTVLKLQVDAGLACEKFHDERVRGLQPRLVQCDELWAFCYAKRTNVATAKSPPPEAGDVWTWTAIDPETKLIIAYWAGDRDAEAGTVFMRDLYDRLADPARVELATDALGSYVSAIENIWEEMPTHTRDSQTSHVERSNLTIRMGNRRFTRRTNAHSKKLRNHLLSLSLYFTYYNWVRPHMSLGPLTTPAMAAGLAQFPISLEEIDALISN